MPVSEIDRHLGHRISGAREAHGMDQTTLAREIEIDSGELADMEAGQLRVSALALARISRTLDTPLSWFYAGLPGQEVIEAKLGSRRLV